MAKRAESQTVNGCAWGRETRIMVDNIKDSVGEIKGFILIQNDKLDEAVKAANGKPSWFVAGLITVLGMLCCGLITYLVTNPHQQHEQTGLVSQISQEIDS